MSETRARYGGKGSVGRLSKAASDRQVVTLAIVELEMATAAYNLAETMADGSMLRREQMVEALRRVGFAARMLGELLR